MNQKILKLAKRLNQFVIDELLMILETDEVKVNEELNKFMDKGYIRRISDKKYGFIKDKEYDQKPSNVNNCTNPIKNTKCDNLKNSKPADDIKFNDFTDIKQHIDKERQKNEYEKYLKAPEKARKKADKYLLVFNAAKGYKGKQLQDFLSDWNKRYPNLKVAYSSFQRNKNKYRKYGISALLPDYGNSRKCPGNAYLMFRKLYLSPERLSAKYCAKLIKEKIPSSPNGYSLLRRLRQEFSQSEINNYRVFDQEIPEFIEKMQIKHDEDNV